MRALIYHNGSLGDFLTALPAIQKYRSVIKSEQTTLLCRKQFGELAVCAGYADSHIDINHCSFLFNVDVHNSRVGPFLSQFTHCLLFTKAESPILINVRNQKQLNVIYQPPFPSEDIPIIDYHLSLFENNAKILSPAYTSLSPLFDQKLDQTGHEAKVPVAAIAPGSGSRLKNWPLQYFQKVGDYLTQKGFDVHWLSGECEEDFQFRNNDKIIRGVDLITLSRFLSRCVLYIGNDSGITHLAAASHCPVIAIFGASNPIIWAPRGAARLTCIFKSTCQNFCQTYGKSVNCGHECLKSIQVEDVLTEINSFIS